MIHLPDEPLWPHLVEIARSPESDGTVLAGGLGLRVKKAHIQYHNVETLFSELPDLRATTDIDLFLEIRLWTNATGRLPLREALERMGYSSIKRDWKFIKDVEHIPNRKIVLDLMAREPADGEEVKAKAHRVGVDQAAETHGFKTPEAFAIEQSPIEVQLVDGSSSAALRIAHPYAYLNLKVAAANDWLLELREEIDPKFVFDADGNPTEARVRAKHVTDVYAVAGMMTEHELQKAQELAQKYADHPKAREIREAAFELYGAPDSQGSAAIRAYNNGAWTEHFDDNYEVFWDALSRALGIKSSSGV